jgi:subtilase family serine protease
MILKKKQILVSAFLVAILLTSSWSIVATGASNSSRPTEHPMVASGSGSGAVETPLYIANFYGTSLPSGQPSPFLCFPVVCYTPQDIKTAYNYPATKGQNGLDGAGQTIVIVDAFGDPAVQHDLNTFDSEFGIPRTMVQIVCQDHVCPVFDPQNADMVSWTGEITLDTQYAHAMAPGAHIVLFVTTSDDDLVMAQGILQAVKMFPHSIISQSWGDPELNLLSYPPKYVESVISTSEAAYKQAAREGTTVFASAGDWGADNSAICVQDDISPCPFTSANPLFPSSSPWVTAVGGTEGNPYYFNSVPTSCTGTTCSAGLVTFLNTPTCQLSTETSTSTASCIPYGYGGEQVWNEPVFDAATGGAPSLIFPVPFYQSGLGLTTRATPDISYNAAISGGVITYWSGSSYFDIPAGFYVTGGTSAGSPQWSAIAALADQLSTQQHKGTIGFIDPTLYAIGHNPILYGKDFHDITVGNNIVATSPYGVGFQAQTGWDDATGLGTPNVANLIQNLVSPTTFG